MNRSMSVWTRLMVGTLVLVCSRGYAEDAAPAKASAPPAAKAAEKPPVAKPLVVRSPYRYLAPGVLISIDPMQRLEESVSRHDVTGLLAIDPKFDWAKDIDFRRDVWVLKFQFKPVRIAWVDVPQSTGKMQRKPIWYMVYVVTNSGKAMHPVEDALPYETAEPRQRYKVTEIDGPVHFVPEFLLVGQEHMKPGEGFTKAYPDRVIPVALGPIRLREDPRRQFLTTVEMCRKEIGVGESVWGVATWEDLDPRIVRFSVFVSGLTNAYRWVDEPGEYKPGDSVLKGRKLYGKTLKLNFSRVGDRYSQHEEEIRYGVPGGVDYEWVYR